MSSSGEPSSSIARVWQVIGIPVCLEVRAAARAVNSSVARGEMRPSVSWYSMSQASLMIPGLIPVPSMPSSTSAIQIAAISSGSIPQ